jgi:thiol-disulfide isomerase/thioredoxin
MKKISILGLLLAAIFTFQNCQTEKAGIKGTIANAANLQVILEQVYFSNTSDARGKADCDAQGSFKIELPEKWQPGVYRLKFGAKKINFIFDGTEKMVEVIGDLNTLEAYDFEVKNAPTSAIYDANIKKMMAEKLAPADIKTMVESSKNPLVAAAMSFSMIGDAMNHKSLFQLVNENLAKYLPGSRYSTDYSDFLIKLQNAMLKQQGTNGSAAAAGIAIGSPAPNVELPDPSGKMRSLANLQGKVVLIDFWASWCGPCRAANPHVVELYKKYKDRGFTVFSISLDGVDTRRTEGANPEEIASRKEESRKKWIEAIKKDNLSWENHVSDLGNWGSAAAQTYGVTSIPRTYLLDKKGNVVAINPREDLESQVKKLL